MRFIAVVIAILFTLVGTPAKASDSPWIEVIPSQNLPTRYYEFMTPFLGPVQGQQYGSCVSNSATGIMAWHSRYMHAQPVDFDYNKLYFDSPGGSFEEVGTHLKTVGAVATNGYWQGKYYVISQNKLYDHKKYPGTAWKSAPPTRNLIKHSIAVQHSPVQIGFLGFNSFKNIFYANNWTPYSPYPGEPNGNYRHAVIAYGYDERGIYIRNSWGTAWGNGGNLLISWEYFDQHVSEAMQYYGFRRK